MKTYRFLALLFVSTIFSIGISAQSADDVINDYISAIGGKKNLDKITSLKMTSQIASDMFEAEATSTLLSGKGYKMEMDVMGYQSVSCFTDEGGWRTDPMSGSTEQIPEDEYKIGKGQIFVGGPWESYSEIGFKVELVGRADVNGVNTYQIRLTVDGTDTSTDHFFDPDSHLLIRSSATVEAQGYDMEMVTDYKEYKEIEGGIKLSHVQEIDYGGQMSMEITLNTVEVNVPVDPAIFSME